MKNSRSIIVGLFLLMGTVGVFAFTGPSESQSKIWYEYDGTGPINDPTNYSLAGGTGQEPECDQGTVLCAVFAEPSGTPGQPNLSTVDHGDDKFRD